MAKSPTFVCAPPASGPTSSSLPEDLDAQFELLGIIGEGGMGTVWRARDRMLGVEVALKVIPPDSEDAVAAGRLVAEARAAARVRHPSAVQILRSGISPQGSPYIVMELLTGEPLDELLGERGHLGPHEALAMMLPVIGAVSAAHEQGIIHRDIKPSNIFLHRQGARVRPTLLDFGIAKQTLDVSVSMTMPGSIMGTPSYMAPEQACGHADVDPRADVWSLCAVLYELLTGKQPFPGENYNQVISSVLCEEPERPRDVDDWLWSILEQGLTKDRDDRFQTARELGRRLAGWLLAEGVEHDVTHTAIRSGSMRPDALAFGPPLSSTGTLVVPTRPPSVRSPRRKAFSVAGVGLATGMALTITWLAASRDTREVPRQASFGQTTSFSAPALHAAETPSSSATMPAPPARQPTAVRRKSASASPTPTPEPVRVAPVGPGRHGMPLPSDESF